MKLNAEVESTQSVNWTAVSRGSSFDYGGGIADLAQAGGQSAATQDNAEAALSDAFVQSNDYVDGEGYKEGALAEAIIGDTQTAEVAKDQVADELMVIEQLVLGALRENSGSGFVRPEIQFVPNQLGADPDATTVLPEGVTGAFVPGLEGDPGTILISEDLAGDPSLNGVVLEELGEAVGQFVVENGYVPAPGDIGARIAKVLNGQELSESDFVAEETDTTLILYEGEENVEAFTSWKRVQELVPIERSAVYDRLDSVFGQINTAGLDRGSTEIVTYDSSWKVAGAAYEDARSAAKNVLGLLRDKMGGDDAPGVFYRDNLTEANLVLEYSEDYNPGWVYNDQWKKIVEIYGTVEPDSDRTATGEHEPKYIGVIGLSRAILDGAIILNDNDQAIDINFHAISPDAYVEAVFERVANMEYAGAPTDYININEMFSAMDEINDLVPVALLDYEDEAVSAFSDGLGETFSRAAMAKMMKANFLDLSTTLATVINPSNTNADSVTDPFGFAPIARVDTYSGIRGVTASQITPVARIQFLDDREVDEELVEIYEFDDGVRGHNVGFVLDGEIHLVKDYDLITDPSTLMIEIPDRDGNVAKYNLDLTDPHSDVSDEVQEAVDGMYSGSVLHDNYAELYANGNQRAWNSLVHAVDINSYENKEMGQRKLIDTINQVVSGPVTLRMAKMITHAYGAGHSIDRDHLLEDVTRDGVLSPADTNSGTWTLDFTHMDGSHWAKMIFSKAGMDPTATGATMSANSFASFMEATFGDNLRFKFGDDVYDNGLEELKAVIVDRLAPVYSSTGSSADGGNGDIRLSLRDVARIFDDNMNIFVANWIEQEDYDDLIWQVNLNSDKLEAAEAVDFDWDSDGDGVYDKDGMEAAYPNTSEGKISALLNAYGNTDPDITEVTNQFAPVLSKGAVATAMNDGVITGTSTSGWFDGDVDLSQVPPRRILAAAMAQYYVNPHTAEMNAAEFEEVLTDFNLPADFTSTEIEYLMNVYGRISARTGEQVIRLDDVMEAIDSGTIAIEADSFENGKWELTSNFVIGDYHLHPDFYTSVLGKVLAGAGKLGEFTGHLVEAVTPLVAATALASVDLPILAVAWLIDGRTLPSIEDVSTYLMAETELLKSDLTEFWEIMGDIYGEVRQHIADGGASEEALEHWDDLQLRAIEGDIHARTITHAMMKLSSPAMIDQLQFMADQKELIRILSVIKPSDISTAFPQIQAFFDLFTADAGDNSAFAEFGYLGQVLLDLKEGNLKGLMDFASAQPNFQDSLDEHGYEVDPTSRKLVEEDTGEEVGESESKSFFTKHITTSIVFHMEIDTEFIPGGTNHSFNQFKPYVQINLPKWNEDTQQYTTELKFGFKDTNGMVFWQPGFIQGGYAEKIGVGLASEYVLSTSHDEYGSAFAEENEFGFSKKVSYSGVGLLHIVDGLNLLGVPMSSALEDFLEASSVSASSVRSGGPQVMPVNQAMEDAASIVAPSTVSDPVLNNGANTRSWMDKLDLAQQFGGGVAGTFTFDYKDMTENEKANLETAMAFGGLIGGAVGLSGTALAAGVTAGVSASPAAVVTGIHTGVSTGVLTAAMANYLDIKFNTSRPEAARFDASWYAWGLIQFSSGKGDFSAPGWNQYVAQLDNRKYNTVMNKASLQFTLASKDFSPSAF